MSQSGFTIAGKFRRVYCFYCLERRVLVNLIQISMQEGTSLCRKAFYLDSLNINDLPRPT